MESMIRVQNLTKKYNGITAINNISFDVKKGLIFALLGPNGAGKSTTLNILCTGIPASSGQVIIKNHILGIHNRDIRRQIGVVFQNGLLDDGLTIEENLYVRGRFYGLKGKELSTRIISISEMTGIRSFLQQYYGSLSGGQRRRCDIARALIPFPSILFLDEPTAGLDPEIRSALWRTLKSIQTRHGITMLLTTHDMEEAAFADQILILKKGSIIAQDSPALLKKKFAGDTLRLFSDCIDMIRFILDRQHISYQYTDRYLGIPLAKTTDALPLLNLCRGNYTEFEVRKGNLKEAYLTIIGEG